MILTPDYEAFTTLRVYAVSMRNRWLASLVALLGLVPIAINLVSPTKRVNTPHSTEESALIVRNCGG